MSRSNHCPLWRRQPRSLPYCGAVASVYDIGALLAWRSNRDHEYRTHYASPIPDEDLERFTGLQYFDPDPDFELVGPFRREEGRIAITSSTGSVSSYKKAGRVLLAIGGAERWLVVLHGEEDDLYIPFSDTTCGSETYGGGRYVRVRPVGDDELIVDFNRATNPACAYDPEFSCPLPPVDNRLTVPVRAGEKDYTLRSI